MSEVSKRVPMMGRHQKADDRYDKRRMRCRLGERGAENEEV